MKKSISELSPLSNQPLSQSYRMIVVFGILILIFGLDQATKAWAVQTLLGKEPLMFLGGVFQLVYAENPGAFLGLGGDWSRATRFVVFALVVTIGLGAMLWFLIKKEKSKVNLFAYSFILAGGCGNLWDRMAHDHGHVIDFLLIQVWGPIRTGVFNLADMAIVVGVFLALLGEYFFDRRGTSHAKHPTTG